MIFCFSNVHNRVAESRIKLHDANSCKSRMSAANSGETTPGQQQQQQQPHRRRSRSRSRDAPRATDASSQQVVFDSMRVCSSTGFQLDKYISSVPDSDKSHASTIAAIESELASMEEARRTARAHPALQMTATSLKRAATACREAAMHLVETGREMSELETETLHKAHEIEIAAVHLDASLQGEWTGIARLAESVRLIRTVQFISDIGAAVLFVNIEPGATGSLGHRLFENSDSEAPSDGSAVARLERQVCAVVNAATQRTSVLVRIECAVGKRSETGDLPLLPIKDAPAEICIDGKWRQLQEYWMVDVRVPDTGDVFRPVLYVIGNHQRNEPIWAAVRAVLHLRGRAVMGRDLGGGERARDYLVGECLLATRPQTGN